MKTKEEMRKEAVLRMEKLNLLPKVISDFKKKKPVLYASEFFGALYWLSDEEKELVKEFEDHSGCLVYHAVRTASNIGDLFSMIFVSQYEEEWESDRELLREGIVYANVRNLTYDFEDLGTIGVKPSFGGLMRTA